MDNTNTLEHELSVGDLWKVLRRACVLMVIAAVLFAAAHGVYNYLTYSPSYLSEGTLSTMREGSQSHPGNEVEYAIFVQTQCVELMKTRSIYEAVVQECGLSIGWSKLRSIITVTPVESTSLIKVSVRAGNPESAQAILTSYMQHSIAFFSDPANGLLGPDQKIEKMGTVIDPASLPKAAVNSPFSVVSVFFGVVAAIIVYGVFLVRYIMRGYTLDERWMPKIWRRHSKACANGGAEVSEAEGKDGQ